MNQFQAGNIDWARKLMIKEAYGFALTVFFMSAWREALGKSADFKIDQPYPIADKDSYIPDERRSLYSSAHILFINEYMGKHGLKLIFDRELATKKYR